MASGESLFCIDETTVAGALAGASVPDDPAQTQVVATIAPKRGEVASARAGENAASLGGK